MARPDVFGRPWRAKLGSQLLTVRIFAESLSLTDITIGGVVLIVAEGRVGYFALRSSPSSPPRYNRVMDWRRTVRSAWQSTLNIGGCLIVLFSAVLLFAALRVFFLELVVPLGPVITETIGRSRLLLVRDAAVTYAPYAASVAGAGAILYLVQRINRRDDPQCAALPPSDWDSSESD